MPYVLCGLLWNLCHKHFYSFAFLYSSNKNFAALQLILCIKSFQCQGKLRFTFEIRWREFNVRFFLFLSYSCRQWNHEYPYKIIIDILKRQRRSNTRLSINRKPILYSIIMIKRIVTVLLCLSFSPLLITFCGLRAFFYILLILCGLCLTFVWCCFL